MIAGLTVIRPFWRRTSAQTDRLLAPQDSVCSRDIASVALTLSPLARAKAKRMNRDQGWLNFRIANQPDITQRGHAYQYQGRGDKFATRKEADRGAGASTAQRLLVWDWAVGTEVTSVSTAVKSCLLHLNELLLSFLHRDPKALSSTY